MSETNHISEQVKKVFGNDCSLYSILGIEKSASTDEIKKAYRKKALIMHPDKGGDPEKFQALSAVHAILSDETKRKIYDQTGALF